MRPFIPSPLASLAVAVAALLASGAGLPTRAAVAGDCAPRVEAAAEKVFGAFVGAFRRASASGVVALMAPGDDARLTLRLSGVRAGSYSSEQALEVLKRSYFGTRAILSVVEGEGCTRGGETRLVRSYRLRVRAQGVEQERTLTAVIVKAGEAWHLDSASDS